MFKQCEYSDAHAALAVGLRQPKHLIANRLGPYKRPWPRALRSCSVGQLALVERSRSTSIEGRGWVVSSGPSTRSACRAVKNAPPSWSFSKMAGKGVLPQTLADPRGSWFGQRTQCLN